MKNEQWLAIYNVFEQMEQICGDLKIPTDDMDSSFITPEGDTAAQKKSGLKGEHNEDIVKVRAHIRTQLDFLRAKLGETLPERDCYLILFAIVAHFDESVQANYLNRSNTFWPTLQKEFFKIDDAGEIFYETLDDILRKPQTIPLVYEVFYFCLNHGFKGKYIDNPVKINEYLKKLRVKIPVHEVENIQTVPNEISQIKYVGTVAWYYVIAAGILGVAYLFFQAMANYW